jgi:hypothetical protein
MLYSLGGLVLTFLFIMFALGVARDTLRDPGRFWPEAVDMGAAIVPSLLCARLLLTAAVWNATRFRPGEDDGAAPFPPPPPPDPLPVPANPLPRPPSLSAAARSPQLEAVPSH